MTTTILGTGSTLPDLLIKNAHFLNHTFYDSKGIKNVKPTAEIIEKLEAITGITERRYVPFDQDSIPLMRETALKVLDAAHLSANDLSGIIVAHNAGNMIVGGQSFHPVPNLAACLKNAIDCTNHECFAFDLLFGCPGWIQAMIQAHQAILCGEAEHVLVLGLEVASRMLDPHDLDSMILADGCGGCIVSKNPETAGGLLSYATFSHSQDDLRIIFLDKSNNAPELAGSCYFHMNGKEVYKYATQWLPKVIEKALIKADLSLEDIDLFLFHQANAKMLEAISRNIARLYNVEYSFFDNKVPRTVEFLGNTSVATIPTMLDMILKNELGDFSIKKGQKVVFASVGAGMHCNAMVYQF